MKLKDIIKRKDKSQAAPSLPAQQQSTSEIKFVRSDTFSQETLQPPNFGGPGSNPGNQQLKDFGQSRHSFDVSSHSRSNHELSPGREKGERRLSHRLHLGRSSRSGSTSSVHVPANLPSIENDSSDAQEREAQWEKRATILAQGVPNIQSPTSPGFDQRPRSPSVCGVNNSEGDVNIQEAIRLHENGELSKSTEMFGKLANPDGANNALSQVLYGLALRHGWGCNPDPERAVTYLSAAAANSASVEAEALNAGLKKGGAAKGELVLAIFELANCFRYAWGVTKDPVAARQYYETAANLGDVDAMNEAAWCFEEGFGGKKNKYTAAKYYRLAEENGSKTLGNSWIWKDKYNPK